MEFICNDCGFIFDEDEADEMAVDLEFDLGVGGLFPDHHTANVYICPECCSDDLDVYEEPEQDEDEEGEEDETD